MIELKFWGEQDATLESTPIRPSNVANVSVVATGRLTRERSSQPQRSIPAQPDDVLELHLEGGLRWWISPEQLGEDLDLFREGGGEKRSLVLPDTPFAFPAERGPAGRFAIKTFQLLRIDVAEMGGELLAEIFEKRLQRAPGLYRLSTPGVLGELAAPASSNKPALILIHGTFSSTAGSFADLAVGPQTACWPRLLEHYGEGNVYGLEHKTLSVSPLRNAIDLLNVLPKGVELHLLSHSRGGLVGDLLCIEPSFFTGEPFAGALGRLADERAEEAAAWSELGRLIEKKRPRVTRFVRVACPARGTTLASGRLDRYLSILVNLVGSIPALSSSPIYDGLSELVLAVAKQRTRAEALPGLEAQMPESPFIRMLNIAPAVPQSDLTAIVGDLDARGFLKTLKEITLNFFYRENNDLVVNTSAMTGGVKRRPAAGRFYMAKGPEIEHCRYFCDEKVREHVVAGLLATESKETKFEPIEATTPADIALRAGIPARTRGVSRGEAKPVVYVLPGIMGSHLAVGGDRVWLDVDDVIAGKLTHLRIDTQDVRPQALLASAYGDLVEFLSASHQVEPFPYDWRRSLRDEARRLSEALEKTFASTPQPVRLLAHSMGGLLARIALADRNDLAQELRRRQGRLLMLGTPNGGSMVPVTVLLGRERIVRNLALADLWHARHELLEMFARFPGLLEMLPAERQEHDFFALETWERLHEQEGRKWTLPRAEDLARALEIRQLLDENPCDPQLVCYVAGKAPKTADGVSIRPGSGELELTTTPGGDGRVPWSTGIPAGMEASYLDEEHGDLPASRRAFPAFLELLSTGQTTRLGNRPPADRGPRETPDIGIEPIDQFPDTADLEAAAVGGSTRREEPPSELDPLRVEVVHGSLTAAHGAVLVGHYENDVIVAAEATLDRELEGRLSERRRLDVYPGAIGTAAVVRNLRRRSRLTEAIVVGLGPVGELTAGDVTIAVQRGVIDHTLAVAENSDPASAVSPRPRKLYTLLIGTGDQTLSIDDSIAAIVDGVLGARRSLQRVELAKPVLPRELVFIELYFDRAVQAGHALRRLAESPRYRTRILTSTVLKQVAGGERRVSFEEAPGWWRRLKITGTGDTLIFTAMTRRARAEERSVKIQTRLIDPFITEAADNGTGDPAVTGALYELLIPNWMKRAAPDQSDLLLLVDERSAAYPWELLHDRLDGHDEPMAVRTRMIRQLVQTEFRESVRDTTGDNVLVVGDPKSNFVPLEGAQQEAREVGELFKKAAFKTTLLHRESPGTIVKKLFEMPWRILHLAGHGVYELALEPRADDAPHEGCAEPPKRVTGMVIGDGVFLTPAEIEQMRFVPELVFLSCCFLGKVESDHAELRRDRHRLAANLATQLIRMGVRAVVAAGWGVSDDAALTFATSFYRELLEKQPFAKAVHKARQQTYQRHGASNTWGAYQCYGDPAWVLRPSHNRLGTGISTCVTAEEVVSQLLNLAGRASQAETAVLDTIRAKVEKLETQAKQEEWDRSAEVSAALGKAWGELGELERACRHYENARAAEKARVSLEALEQLANLRARAASLRGGPGAEAAIDQSIAELLALPSPNPENHSVERSSLLGSCYKRLASLRKGRGRREALKAMAGWYEKAHQRALEIRRRVDPYPLLNWLTARMLLDMSTAPADLDSWIDQALAVAEKDAKDDPSFWNTATRFDAEVVRYLADASLADHASKIAAEYAEIARFASPRELSSAVEHLAWLCKMLEPTRAASGNAMTRKLDGVQLIAQRLEAIKKAREDDGEVQETEAMKSAAAS